MWLFATLAIVHHAGCAASTTSPYPTAPEQVTQSIFGRSWRWYDESGRMTTLARWRGTPMIVSAVYTSCTSRCPMTIQKLRAVDEAYRAAGVRAEVVLITLDPRADTPDRLRRFKASHGLPEAWHLLSGDQETTRETARFLGARAAFDDGHIDHEARISVFDTGGQLSHSAQGWDYDPASMVIR